MIRGRLWIKFMAGFAAVVIVGGAVLYMVINLSTRRQYETLARESDIAGARYLVPLFAAYYDRTGSWTGVEEFVRQLAGDETGRMGRQPQGGAMGGMMGGMMMRRYGLFSRIVLTGPEGRVLFDSRDRLDGTFHPPRHVDRGVPVRSFGRVEGHLFVGTMIEPALDPVEREFLRTVNRTVIITLTAVLAAALAVTSLLVRGVTVPLKRIEEASSLIGSGRFSVRVSVPRNDELGVVAERFNAMAASLEEAEIWRNQLISDSAHELRTPMSLIQGRLEMMVEGVYDISRENITAVYEEARHMADLIEELGTLSDADRGMLLSERKPVDINSTVERAAEAFRIRTEAAGISFTVESSRVPAFVEADEQKIYQVLLNVLSNAVRFSPPGTAIEVRTAIAGDISGKRVEVSVADSGPGVPEDKLEQIFLRFYRIDSSRNREHGGRGLGLAISKVIVESHGGTIRAENRREGGTVIRILLPLTG